MARSDTITERMSGLIENLQDAVRKETRRDVADMIDLWAKPNKGSWGDLAAEVGDSEWEPTPEFLAGMRLAAKLARTLAVEL